VREIQVIKNIQGKTLGRLYEDSNPDNQVLQNLQGAVIGRYTKSSNITFDGHGKAVGRGNIIMTLIQ